jgi:hypothetical protein
MHDEQLKFYTKSMKFKKLTLGTELLEFDNFDLHLTTED